MVDIPGRPDYERDDDPPAPGDRGWGSPVPAEYGSLRAVGPPNSEDTRVVQSIAAQLAREQFNIRLQTKVLDGGPPAAAGTVLAAKRTVCSTPE